MRQHIDATHEEVWREFRTGSVPKYFGVADLPKWKEDVGLFGNQEFCTVPLYENAANVVYSLAQTKRLALISDSRRPFIEPSLHYRQLRTCFEFIVTEEDVPHKPDATGILNTLTFFNVSPAQVVMVGDSAKDLQAAANAGIDSILFYPPSHQGLYDLNELLEYHPTHVIASFTELPGLVG